ncbi:hypothetical protein K3495_g6978 [Podosphaera aphanis]|nr:hypothetical protein K3495_g6978 [Podosphaera aphanis]
MSTTLGSCRRTRAKPNISYAEFSSSSSDSEDDTSDHSSFTGTVTHVQASPPKHKESKTRRRQNFEAVKNQRVTKRRRKTKSTLKKLESENISPLESGVIPPWQTLPFHIIVQIFEFASFPLYDENTFQPFPSIQWLLKIARLCRAFTEPAFNVLYLSPPLVPMIQAHMLVDLLKCDPIPLSFKYRQKIVSLHIEVEQVATYTLRGSGHLDLYSLIRNLPRLRDLEFFHQKDMAPYRDLDVPIKWTYPDAVFEALDYVDPKADGRRGDKTSISKLRSWRWSSRLAEKKWPLEKLCQVHIKPSFKSVRKMAFVNYQATTPEDGEEDPNYETILADAIKILPNIEHLIFESSTLLNSRLLSQLPQNLTNIEIINCWELTSDELGEFLITHGQKLRCLVLNHNKSLNLTFLTVLGSACPQLRILQINMTYFNVHPSYRDSEPAYDHLLLPSQTPTWPTKLQTIELSQLRKWDIVAAEMFFTSLVENATNLPDLRRLSIQVILNVGWRNRATFRDKWVALLNKVFKRAPEQPLPVHTLNPDLFKLDQLTPISLDAASLEAGQISCLDRELINSKHTTNISTKIRESSPRRSQRSTTLAVPRGRYNESSSSEDSENSEAEYFDKASKDAIIPETKARGRLVRELQILRATGGVDLSTLVSSPPETPVNIIATQIREKQKEFVQGMCEVVEVRIDNLRPAENQVTEADFLDDEISGDEDWNSEAEKKLWPLENSDPGW